MSACPDDTAHKQMLSLISADNTCSGLPVVLPAEKEAVLVGAAVLGACASLDYKSIQVGHNSHRNCLQKTQ